MGRLRSMEGRRLWTYASASQSGTPVFAMMNAIIKIPERIWHLLHLKLPTNALQNQDQVRNLRLAVVNVYEQLVNVFPVIRDSWTRLSVELIIHRVDDICNLASLEEPPVSHLVKDRGCSI